MSIFIDLEMNTTDVRLVHKKDLRNEIIEIGAVRMDDAFHPLDRFRIFVRPQYNGVIERKIYKLTGISNGAVSDAVYLPKHWMPWRYGAVRTAARSTHGATVT